MSDVKWETVEVMATLGDYSLVVAAPSGGVGSGGTKWFWMVWLGRTDRPDGECRRDYADSEAEARAAAIACALTKPKRATR